MSKQLIHVCQYCGCSELDACALPGGKRCDWLDADRTVCTNPACVRAWAATLGRGQAAELIWARLACDLHCSIDQAKRMLTPREAADAVLARLNHPTPVMAGGGA